MGTISYQKLLDQIIRFAGEKRIATMIIYGIPTDSQVKLVQDLQKDGISDENNIIYKDISCESIDNLFTWLPASKDKLYGLRDEEISALDQKYGPGIILLSGFQSSPVKNIIRTLIKEESSSLAPRWQVYILDNDAEAKYDVGLRVSCGHLKYME